jgi:hypothetical protein
VASPSRHPCGAAWLHLSAGDRPRQPRLEPISADRSDCRTACRGQGPLQAMHAPRQEAARAWPDPDRSTQSAAHHWRRPHLAELKPSGTPAAAGGGVMLASAAERLARRTVAGSPVRSASDLPRPSRSPACSATCTVRRTLPAKGRGRFGTLDGSYWVRDVQSGPPLGPSRSKGSEAGCRLWSGSSRSKCPPPRFVQGGRAAGRRRSVPNGDS